MLMLDLLSQASGSRVLDVSNVKCKMSINCQCYWEVGLEIYGFRHSTRAKHGYTFLNWGIQRVTLKGKGGPASKAKTGRTSQSSQEWLATIHGRRPYLGWATQVLSLELGWQSVLVSFGWQQCRIPPGGLGRLVEGDAAGDVEGHLE